MNKISNNAIKQFLDHIIMQLNGVNIKRQSSNELIFSVLQSSVNSVVKSQLSGPIRRSLNGWGDVLSPQTALWNVEHNSIVNMSHTYIMKTAYIYQTRPLILWLYSYRDYTVVCRAATNDYFHCWLVVWSIKCHKMMKNVQDDVLECLLLSTTQKDIHFTVIYRNHLWSWNELRLAFLKG